MKRGSARRVLAWVALAATFTATVSGAAAAETEEGEVSPWLVLPIVSSSPKLGTSAGVLGAYVHRFDPESRPSMFGMAAQYTSTGSLVGGAFARTSWAKDHHRVIAFAGGGEVKNDYDDFLGTGQPLKTEDNLKAFVGRYLYRVRGPWFLGGQGAYTDYVLLGEAAFDEQVLTVLGLTGFEAGGLGGVVYRDSRDDEDMPTRGWLLNLNNLAYREWLGGEDSFDVYRADLRAFWQHGKGHVLALHQENQWTHDAPPAAFAPISLRGYKFGQYLGENMSALEAEERLFLAPRWTATVFAGVAGLYGDALGGSELGNLYANAGLGIQFVIRPEDRSLANLEYAKGEGDNQGVYLKLGYGF